MKLNLYRVRYLFIGINGVKIIMAGSAEIARRDLLDALPGAAVLSVTEVSNG